MKPMKRNHGQDQFGRSGSVFPIRLLALATFAVIVGSAWPISARSRDPACDTKGDQGSAEQRALRLAAQPTRWTWCPFSRCSPTASGPSSIS